MKTEPIRGLCFRDAQGNLWPATFVDCRGERAKGICQTLAADQWMSDAERQGAVVEVVMVLDPEGETI